MRHVSGGAASKALLTVRYDLPGEIVEGGPPLQTELFVKMPHKADRKREKYLCACIYAHDGPEVVFAQAFAKIVPMKAPRTYFADRCARTTNFIMITEKLDYATEVGHAPPAREREEEGGSGTRLMCRVRRARFCRQAPSCKCLIWQEEHPRGVAASLAPFKLQRAFSKFHDHYLGVDPSAYYLVLVRKLGQVHGRMRMRATQIAARLGPARRPCLPCAFHRIDLSSVLSCSFTRSSSRAGTRAVHR